MAACLLLVFIQGWIVWYLTYFKKKGEYEAMKEEVSQITKLTESIKSELNVLTQKELNLDLLRRNSILEYNDSLELALNDLFFKVKVFDLRGLDEYHTSTYPRYLIAMSRLRLCTQMEVVDQLTSEINTHLEALMIATENSASYYAATKKIDLIHHSEFSRQFENLERCRVKLNAILFQLL